MDENRKEDLLQEIEQLTEKVTQLKEELDAVRAKLDKEPVTPNQPTEQEPQSPDEPTDAEQGADEGEGVSDKTELEKQEEKLFEELVSAQMKLLALQKELNDIDATDAMDNFEEE